MLPMGSGVLQRRQVGAKEGGKDLPRMIGRDRGPQWALYSPV